MEKKKPTESYTVISTDLKDPIMTRLEFFVDRDKMREFLLEYAKQHKRCIVLPGPVDDVDYQVEYEADQETIKCIHFEDEPGYKPPFDLLKVKNGEFVSAIPDLIGKDSE
jgi:hypothetical protein